MIEFLENWVINIVTLVIFLLLLEILLPSGKIKKFVNLISGFILMAALINPFLGFINKDIDLKSLQFSESNFLDKKDIEEKSKILNDKQMKQIAEVYRGKIIKELEDSIKDVNGISDVEADVIINEDYKSETFGDIKRVYLSIKPEEDGNSVKPVRKIEEISINGDQDHKKEVKEVNGEMKRQIEDKVTEFLGMKKENIVITLQDG